MVKRAAQVLWPIAMGLWQRSNLCACWSRATLKLIEYSHYSNTFMPFFLMNLSQFDNSTFWVCQIQILVYLVFLNFSGRNFVWWDWADYSSLNELWKNSEAIPLVGKSLGILEELSEQMASAIVIKRWHLQFYLLIRIIDEFCSHLLFPPLRIPIRKAGGFDYWKYYEM